jgi:hypothetical protein
MASPFSIFRRNQRVLMAVSGVMAMIVFVFIGPVSQYWFGRKVGGENPILVKTNSHNYYASELSQIMNSRRVLENFLARVAVERVQKAMEIQQFPARQAQAYAEAMAENWRQDLLVRYVPPDDIPPGEDDDPQSQARRLDEASAVQTIVLSEKAEALGIEISDQAINEYLKSKTDNVISATDFQKIIQSLHAESGNITQAYLFDALRRELLASRLSVMFQISLAGIPPAARWDYFQQLNRRATAEVVGVPVAKYMQGVPEPTEAELKEFFAKYDKALPVVGSPTPGFRQPVKADFQYFKATFSEFNERALAQVTPEEMHEFYEKNKDVRFRERKEAPADATDDSDSGDDKADEKAGTDKPEKPAADSKDSTTPAADGEEKKSSQIESASPFRPAVFAQKTDDTTPAADAPAGGEAEKKPAAEPTDDKNGASADASAGEGSPAATASDEKPAKPEVKYEPFEKVEEEIRKALAGEKAVKMMDDAFAKLSTKMREYASLRGVYEANREEDPTLEAPEPLDLAALAPPEQMTAGQTGLISAQEAVDGTDIGSSFSFVLDRRSSLGFREVPFVQIGFGEHLFKPDLTEDRDGNHYLSWKIKETPATVPALDEVRKEVIQAYKMIEARKRAVAAAEQLAKEAREAKKPLSEVLTGRDELEVVDTGPFTWMTMGSVAFDPSANQPRMSAVHGVEGVGPAVMEAVFNSTPDQIRVALNQPETIAYVLQVKSFEPPQEDLERQFIGEDFRKYARLSDGDQRDVYLNWIRTLDRQAGVEWVNTNYLSRRAAN